MKKMQVFIRGCLLYTNFWKGKYKTQNTFRRCTYILVQFKAWTPAFYLEFPLRPRGERVFRCTGMTRQSLKM